jgi:hypothetical protein
MKATSTTTKCQSCGALVECAQHLCLCDSCLDARLAELERSLARPRRRPSALLWPTAGMADGWRGALTAGEALQVAPLS